MARKLAAMAIARLIHTDGLEGKLSEVFTVGNSVQPYLCSLRQFDPNKVLDCINTERFEDQNRLHGLLLLLKELLTLEVALPLEAKHRIFALIRRRADVLMLGLNRCNPCFVTRAAVLDVLITMLQSEQFRPASEV